MQIIQRKGNLKIYFVIYIYEKVNLCEFEMYEFLRMGH